MRDIYFFITGGFEGHPDNCNFLKVTSLRKIASVSFALLLLFCINNIYARAPGSAWEYWRSITLSSGFWMYDVRCWILDVGYLILDVRCGEECLM